MDTKSGRRTDRIHLSAALERGLTEAPATAWRPRWREENREAIAAYNEFVEQHGVFSDGIQAIAATAGVAVLNLAQPGETGGQPAASLTPQD